MSGSLGISGSYTLFEGAMNFFSIKMLWLIWAVPALFLICLWGFRERKAILSGYATKKGLSAISPRISAFRRWLKTGVLLFTLLLMAISLAGPQYGYSWKEIERRGVDLMLVIDCSRSMLAEDIRPNRLERAKREVLDLLGMLRGDRMGLVAFAGTAFIQCPLTLDYEGFHLFLDALSPDFLPVGGTDLAGALSTAVSAFNREDATDKAIILITDGESTGEDPVAAARKAADARIKLFCIGVGAGEGVPIPTKDGGFVKDRNGNIVLSKLDETTLKQMAAVASGAYVRSVAGDMDLDAIYQRYIRGTMEAADLGEQKTRVFENRYQWVLSLSVFLLFMEFLIPVKKMVPVWVLVMLLSACPRPAAASELKEALGQGQAAYTTEDYEAAVQHFIAAQLEAPDKAEIAYNLGNSRYKAGDYDGAIQAFRQVLETGDVSLKEMARYNMGNAYFRKGDLDKAIENYEAALSLDKSDVQARENLDFVKELKANPPPETPRDQQNSEDKNDPKNEGEQKQPGEQGRNEPKKQQESDQNRQPESGKESNREEPENRQSPPPEQGSPSGPRQSEDSGQAADKQGEFGSDEEALRQAEKMLNRLQDQPGRAMIPNYRERQVEKDW